MKERVNDLALYLQHYGNRGILVPFSTMLRELGTNKETLLRVIDMAIRLGYPIKRFKFEGKGEQFYTYQETFLDAPPFGMI